MAIRLRDVIAADKGGGVEVYIKDTLFDKCTVHDDLPKSTLEALCIEVKPVRDLHRFVVLNLVSTSK